MKPNILLVATGSVAVIKTIKIFENLKQDFNVQVIATPYVRNNYLLKLPLAKEKLNLISFPQHIAYAKWADLIVVAPASANTLAKFVNGIADNEVLATLLAARSKILFAPAMNTFMYQAIIKRNVLSKIAKLDHFVVGPIKGRLWEDEIGMGRMTEPLEIGKVVRNYFKTQKIKILIVNNASKIEIDPIRYITTKASGQTGKLLANELELNGYNVQLIDVSNYKPHELVAKIKKQAFDIYISPAAINDFWVEKKPAKIKKQDQFTIKLQKSLDVVSQIMKLGKTIITFKNDNDKQSAITKLNNTKSIFIVWTKIGAMGSELVSGAIILQNKSELPFTSITKHKLAKMIVKTLQKFIKN